MDMAMAPGAKPAVQSRSKATREKLLAAMDALLKERPFDAVTVAALSSRAGVSAASIYQRFSNRDALIAILIELYMRRVEEWSRSPKGMISFEKAGTLRKALQEVGKSAWVQVEQLGYIMRPAYLHSRLRPDLIGDQWSANEKKARKGFFALMKAFPNELAGLDVSAVADMVAYFFNMMLLGKLLHAPAAATLNLPKTKTAFANALSEFVCGYLAEKRASNKTSARGRDNP